MRKIYSKGFTLIELLIAIAIVGIIAVVAFVALNPAKRLLDSRTAKRFTDVSAILEAIKVAQVDDGGAYKGTGAANSLALADVAADGANRMIISVVGTLGVDCAARVVNTDCDVVIAADSCVDLTQYVGVGGYLSALPKGPKGVDVVGVGALGRLDWSTVTNETGYYLQRNAAGTITVGSCDGEPETVGITNAIRITR